MSGLDVARALCDEAGHSQIVGMMHHPMWVLTADPAIGTTARVLGLAQPAWDGWGDDVVERTPARRPPSVDP